MTGNYSNKIEEIKHQAKLEAREELTRFIERSLCKLNNKIPDYIEYDGRMKPMTIEMKIELLIENYKKLEEKNTQ